MRKSIANIMLVSVLATASSTALADTRNVHKQGTDTATCGQNTNTSDTTNGPCATIGQAYTNAKNGGGAVARVQIISNGFFNENLTLDNPSGATEIWVTEGRKVRIGGVSGTIITVNTPGKVRLYDLLIGGNGGVSTDAIDVVQVKTLELHRIQIRGFSGTAIDFAPDTGDSNPSLYIFDSDITDSAGGLILLKPSGARGVNAVIKNTQIHHSNHFGVRSDAGNSTVAFPSTKATLVNCIISNLANAATLASASGTGSARIVLENSVVTNSTTAVASSGANAQVLLNHSNISGNTTGLASFGGGGLFSMGNNVIVLNGDDGPTPTPVSPK
jgi:hypothetical protein